jgi:hypothetical protein
MGILYSFLFKTELPDDPKINSDVQIEQNKSKEENIENKVVTCPKCRNYLLFEFGCYKIACKSPSCQETTTFCIICETELIDQNQMYNHFPNGIYNYCINKKN